MTDKIAYIIDGGFFTKKFKSIFQAFPSADELEAYILSIHKHIANSNHALPDSQIYRIFFYDCKPLNKTLVNPVDGSLFDLSTSPSFKSNQRLQDELKSRHYFALRFGELRIAPDKYKWEQWRVNSRKLQPLTSRVMGAKDLSPCMNQKGVDMRMGLDIASITSKKLCTKLVLLSGDTDMIPAMKTARKEGVQVFLHTFNSVSHLELASHSDVIIRHKDLEFTRSSTPQENLTKKKASKKTFRRKAIT